MNSKLAKQLHDFHLEAGTASPASVDRYTSALHYVKQLVLYELVDVIDEGKVCEVNKILFPRGKGLYRTSMATFGIDAALIQRQMAKLFGGNVGLWNPTHYDGWAHENLEPSYGFMADLHIRLLSIHPFKDGNGRTARVINFWVALETGLEVPVLEPTDRTRYFDAVWTRNVDALADLFEERSR